jgi:integrase
VDVPAGRVFIRKRKNGKPHTIILLEEDIPAIAARVGRAHAAGLRTIWYREMPSGRLAPITPRGYQSASYNALRAAGLENARPTHDLRHHAGTSITRAGGSLRHVMDTLGHEDVRSSARYSHTNEDDLRRVLRHARATAASGDPENMIENNTVQTKRTAT